MPSHNAVHWPIQGLLSQINRVPINVDKDNAQYEALEVYQKNLKKDKDSLKHPIFSTRTIVAVERCGAMDAWIHSGAQW